MRRLVDVSSPALDRGARLWPLTISLAFLAPDLVKAAIDGRLLHGMGIARLIDLPAEWPRQHKVLGFPSL